MSTTREVLQTATGRWVCRTSPHPGLLRLHLFHHRPRRAKSWVSPRLTAGPWYRRSSIYVFFCMPGLHLGSSHVGRGLGTIVQRDEDLVDYTAGTSLSGRRLLLAFAFTKLNFDKEWMTFNDLRLQKLARVSFVSFVGRRPALQRGS